MTVPAAACQQIASLTRTRLAADCAQIPSFPAAALTSARRAFRILSTGTLALLTLAPAAGVAALLAAPRRRRTLVHMTTGGALTVLVTMIMMTGCDPASSPVRSRATSLWSPPSSIH